MDLPAGLTPSELALVAEGSCVPLQEYQGALLRSSYRQEVLLERILAALDTAGATPAPAPLPPESAPTDETTAPKSRRKP